MGESLHSTPASGRVHIGIYGRRNAGKSSLLNALLGQALSIVSPKAGTTTDPVQKAMELLPLGPVVFMDTAGIDDEGELGRARQNKTLETVKKADIALLVVEGYAPLDEAEGQLRALFAARRIPCLIVRSKCDLKVPPSPPGENEVYVSAATGENIPLLRERIAALLPEAPLQTPIIADLLAPGDIVVLVMPIDSAAPKGRLILPQQQTIREILEAGAQALVTQEDGLVQILSKLGESPRMVVTDSQVFEAVARDTPPEIPLTSFSILFARHKGLLRQALAGIGAIERLQDGDRVLVSEGCTHHRQCEDIGTVKLPRWLSDYTGKKIRFSVSSGGDFPEDLSQVKLVLHCGGCMLTQRAMESRLIAADTQGVPITNYGMAIAKLKGILPRSLEPLQDWLDK